MKLELAVTGVGMVTPVGLNAWESFHSVRSDISRLSTQQFPDRTRQWIAGGAVMKWYRKTRKARLRALAETALVEAWHQATLGADPADLFPVGFVLGQTEPGRPGYAFPSDGFDVSEWASLLNIDSEGTSSIVQAGGCSTLIGLEKAAELIRSGKARCCIVGAVDSQLQIRVIRWHEDNFRLKCSYVNDGLMPAEAAGFLVVEDVSAAMRRGADIMAHVTAGAYAFEQANVLSDLPNTAGALTKAVGEALFDAQIPASSIGQVWCDLNGESYRAREWAFTEVRHRFEDSHELLHPADCFGDVGTAADATMLALAVQAQAFAWDTDARSSLVFCGSEGGWRSAVVVRPPQQRAVAAPLFTVSTGEPTLYPVSYPQLALVDEEIAYDEAEDPLQHHFRWELQQEHLDDIAAIYYQRGALMLDTEVEWFRIQEPEQRLLNHLDAAVAGGESSVQAVAAGILSDEEGERFAGTLMLGALASPNALALINDVVVGASDEQLPGIVEALKVVPNPRVSEIIQNLIEHADAGKAANGVYLAGYRRIPIADRILPLLQHSDSALVTAAADALRRLDAVEAVGPIENRLREQNPETEFALLLSALSLGSGWAREYCRDRLRSSTDDSARFAPLLALFGEVSDFDFMMKHRFPADIDKSLIEALGILGNLRAVSVLVEVLKNGSDELKPTAARSLDFITGASLREHVALPEPLGSVDDQQQDYLNHEVEQICLDAGAWMAWARQNRHRFDNSFRWRRGRSISSNSLVQGLGDARNDFRQRQNLYWELVIRTGRSVPFEPDWFVAKQFHAIKQWEALGEAF